MIHTSPLYFQHCIRLPEVLTVRLPDPERVLFIHVWSPLVPFDTQQCVLRLCDKAFCRIQCFVRTRAIVERSRQNPVVSTRRRDPIRNHSRASVMNGVGELPMRNGWTVKGKAFGMSVVGAVSAPADSGSPQFVVHTLLSTGMHL